MKRWLRRPTKRQAASQDYVDLRVSKDMSDMALLQATAEWLSDRLKTANKALSMLPEGSDKARAICEGQSKRCAMLADVLYEMSATLDGVKKKAKQYRRGLK